MEGDHVTQNKKEAKSLKGNIIDACNVLSPAGIRCIVQAYYGANWIILDSRRYLLWNFRLLLCIIYLAVQAAKQL